MRPTDTKRVHAVLVARGCQPVAAARWHVKWTTPGGRVATTVAGHRRQAPGVLRQLEESFAPEFGARWLEEALRG